MGTVVGSNISGDYDVTGAWLVRPAVTGPRSRECGAFEAESTAMALEFWALYAQSPD